jgi:di/tricarboxylate transporter
VVLKTYSTKWKNNFETLLKKFGKTEYFLSLFLYSLDLFLIIAPFLNTNCPTKNY